MSPTSSLHPTTDARSSLGHTGLCFLLFVAVLVGVAYGSLLPFHFSRWSTVEFSLAALLPPSRTGASLEDIVTNLAVYLPVGLTLAVMLRSRWVSIVATVVLSVVVGTCVSTMIEVLQSAIPERVSSWLDVATNTLGSLIGALLATTGPTLARLVSPSLRSKLHDRPLHASAVVLGVGLLLTQLAPLDFVRTTGELHDSFRRAEWSIFGARSSPRGFVNADRWLDEFPSSAWFAACAGMIALDRRLRGRAAFSAFAVAAWETAVFAAVVEGMQLLVRSHVFESSAILMRATAAIIGAAMGTAHAARLQSAPWRERPALLVPTRAILLFAALQAAPLGLQFFQVAQSAAWSAISSPNFALPFVAAWRGSMAAAAGRFVGDALAVTALTIPLSILARRAGSRRPWLAAIVAIIFLGLVATAADATRSNHGIDPTHLLWASLNTLAISRVYPALRTRFYHALNTA